MSKTDQFKAVEQVPILTFLRTLKWIDGQPVFDVIEPYRRRVLPESIDTTAKPDGATAKYNFIFTSRGKKCWKTADMLFAALRRLLAWKTPLGNDCLIVSFDIEYAGECLDLIKKLIRTNPELSKRSTIRKNEVLRREIERWIVKLMREVARRSQDRNQNRVRTLFRSLWAALHALSRGPKVYHEYKYKDPAGPEPELHQAASRRAAMMPIFNPRFARKRSATGRA